MPKIHEIFREQTLPVSLDKAWEFLRSPRNLDAITPDDMSFEIVSSLPDEMYEGLLVQYRIGIPLIGKQDWLTELKHIRHRHSFVDEQVVGPYKFWFHFHKIEECADGVRFVDHVRYVMPMGPLGTIAHAIYVKRQLRTVFDYRREAMERLLGDASASERP